MPNRRAVQLWDEEWLRKNLAKHRSCKTLMREPGCSYKPLIRATEPYGTSSPIGVHTIQERRRAIELCNLGFSTRAIAEELGNISDITVWRWLHEAGCDISDRAKRMRMMRNNPLTEGGRLRLKQIKQAVRLEIDHGISGCQIAKRLGCSPKGALDLLSTPYAKALRWAWAGIGDARTIRKEMEEFGYHQQTIIQVFGDCRE